MVHEIERSPRARRRDANLEKILDAALVLVADDGLDALSMTRLAAAVDYTPGALYRYVDSKDALVSQLVGRVLEDVRAELDRALAALPGHASPLARVFALVHGYRGYAAREPHRFGLLATTLAAPRVVLPAARDAQPVAERMVAAMQPLADALAVAAEAELIDAGDVAERTLCVFALLQGALMMQKQARLAPGLLDVERLASRGVRSLLIGWGARARTVDAAIARVAAPARSRGDA